MLAHLKRCFIYLQSVAKKNCEDWYEGTTAKGDRESDHDEKSVHGGGKFELENDFKHAATFICFTNSKRPTDGVGSDSSSFLSPSSFSSLTSSTFPFFFSIFSLKSKLGDQQCLMNASALNTWCR